MVEIGKRVRATADLLAAPTPLMERLAAVGLDPAGEPAAVAAATNAVESARKFLLLDLRHVTGIDATTANAFATLRRSLEGKGVTMVLTGIGGNESVKRMLVANGVVARDGAWEAGRGCPAFESMDAALVWCEEHFKRIALLSGLLDDLSTQVLALGDVLRMHLDPTFMESVAAAGKSAADLVARMESYMTRRLYRAGSMLFDRGELADMVYVILSGSVVSVFDFKDISGCVPRVPFACSVAVRTVGYTFR
jgi:hypothetical protein